MKLTDIIKVVFLALAILSSSSCEKEESRTSDPTREVTITLDVDRLSLESASIRVSNQTLSEKRAQAVYDALVAEGVNPNQLEKVAMGGTDPMFEKAYLNRVVIMEVK